MEILSSGTKHVYVMYSYVYSIKVAIEHCWCCTYDTCSNDSCSVCKHLSMKA